MTTSTNITMSKTTDLIDLLNQLRDEKADIETSIRKLENTLRKIEEKIQKVTEELSS